MQTDGKVISLFEAKAEKEKEEIAKVNGSEEEGSEDYFASVERRNKEIKDRLKKDRTKANRSVLRSYRIKT